MNDLRQSREYAEYLKKLNWIVEEKDGIYYFIKKIPLIGSVIKIQRPKTINYRYIDVLAVKHKAFQILLEPALPTITVSRIRLHKLILTYGFKISRSTYLPSKTIHIDLSKSEIALLSEMHYKTRYNIKIATRNKLQVTSTRDIKKFADFWQECALKQRGMIIKQIKEITMLYNSFKNKSDIYFAYKEKTVLAGLLIIYSNESAYYMYAAASDAGKKLCAPTLITWEAIKKAKSKKMKIFDFEGIYDERFPIKSWQGFSRFKKSFGGKEIEYPGCYSKLRFPYANG